MTPPAPCTGSAMNAATVSGPSRRMASSSRLAAATPGLVLPSPPSKRYGYGESTCTKLGTKGSNMRQ